MLQRLSILLFLITFSHADYTIIDANEDSVVIEKTTWPVGTSGIILHEINAQHESILARAEVISNEETTTLKILPFTDLKQEALPTLSRVPSIGDSIKLGWMHERALLIAPTQKTYDLITKSQETITFINSDLFAVELSKEGHPSPLKSDFKRFCLDYDIGLIEFIVGNIMYKVDAHSLKLLERIEIDLPKEEAQLPFYSRVKEINADMWGEGSSEIEDYPTYYLSLLGEKHDR